MGVESQTGRMVLLDGQAGVSAGGAASVMPGASGIGRPDGADAHVYGLIVSGSGLVPYVDSAFRVESGMAPVELVVSSGLPSAGKATDDDCAFCDLLGAFNDQQEEDEDETPEEEAETDSTSSEGGPDLIVQAPSVSAVMLMPGQEFTLNVTVHNQGDEQAAATMLHYYRSNNATITSSDTEVGTDALGALDASATSAKSIALTAPTSVSAEVGIYYGACVASVRGESNTDNNCSSAVKITVSGHESPEEEDETPEEDEETTPEEDEDETPEEEGADGPVSIPDDPTPVTITDANLRAAIAAELGKARGATITKGEMKTLTRLELSNAGISDLTRLEFATNLTQLSLDFNNISDISPLRGLTNLTSLSLSGNNISDISPLSGLTKLTWLNLRGNILIISSINDHIPALERSGATVLFDSFRESDFDIELVFPTDFDQPQKRMIEYAARRWMSIIRKDLPDYTFTQGRSSVCGDHSYRIPAGERIDDLRIYITSSSDTPGWGGPNVLRETSHLSVVGCMGFDLAFNNSYFVVVALHEIGHVLGVGTLWDDSGFLQNPSENNPNADTHFNGPLAITAFNDAGGWDYSGAKVPVQRQGGSHWRNSVLEGELMAPSGGAALSAITVQSLADLGYSVDVTQADPYTLPLAAAKASAKITALPTHAPPKLLCGVGEQREPIYVVDPQGRIVRTLQR